ncbi:hypothetical protein MKX08_006227 [Trichoderma sp. CBMAI-0020]|nr:hypothetical protein MKX08_006227 [Trichoderma sp. CBMAI-0020]
MASNARNPNHGAVFSSLRPLRGRLMRAGYVLVSEEQESGSEYSGSTCCCCSSCASSCSCEEYSDDDDDGEEDDGSDDDEIVIEQAEVVEEEEEGYWSDCSACWTRRRERERRGRMGRRFGNRYESVARAVEGDSVLVHHHPFHRGQRRGRNETPQRDRRNTNHVTFRSTNSIITGSNDHAETPSFRGLVDRIVSTTRQLRQGEQPVRHLRSWALVLEDGWTTESIVEDGGWKSGKWFW